MNSRPCGRGACASIGTGPYRWGQANGRFAVITWVSGCTALMPESGWRLDVAGAAGQIVSFDAAPNIAALAVPLDESGLYTFLVRGVDANSGPGAGAAVEPDDRGSPPG